MMKDTIIITWNTIHDRYYSWTNFVTLSLYVYMNTGFYLTFTTGGKIRKTTGIIELQTVYVHMSTLENSKMTVINREWFSLPAVHIYKGLFNICNRRKTLENSRQYEPFSLYVYMYSLENNRQN